MSRKLNGRLLLSFAVLVLISCLCTPQKTSYGQQFTTTYRAVTTNQFTMVCTSNAAASYPVGGVCSQWSTFGPGCTVDSIPFPATAGLKISGQVNSSAPLTFYVMSDSDYSGWYAPCGSTVKGTPLLGPEGINTLYSFNLTFPKDGLYEFAFVSSSESWFTVKLALTEYLPLIVANVSTFLVSSTSVVQSNYPVATANQVAQPRSQPANPLGTLGVIGLIAGVFGVSSLLFFAKKRGPAPSKRGVDTVPKETAHVETGEAILQQLSLPPSIQKEHTQSPGKISTGYAECDALLNGGIPRGLAVVVVSPPFDERGLLLRRMAGSALANGERVFYVSGDLEKTQDLAGRFRTGFIAFCPDAHRISSSVENLRQIPDISNLVEFNILLNKGLSETVQESGQGGLLIMDLATDILVRYKGALTRKWLADFISKRKAQNFTTVCTFSPAISSKEESSRIIELFDGVIEIYEREDQGKPKRFLAIRKMYGQEYSDSELQLERSRLF